jgi:hypothetical protein
MKHEFIRALFVMVTVGGGASVHAQLPLASTQVSKSCEVISGPLAYDQYSSPIEIFEQATACQLQVTSGSALGSASGGFGPATPQVGIATVAANVSAFEAVARADLSGSVLYHFEIQPIDPATPPGAAWSRLPVAFTARGSGTALRSGYGLARSQGEVNLFGNGLSYPDGFFRFDASVVDETAYDPVDEEQQGQSFGETRSLNLYINDTYNVTLSAACSTWVGPVGQGARASAGCTAQVDPHIRFDQAAFDQQMGDQTFVLDDHYRFAFSQNLPVPEPAALPLMAAGLVGVALAVRRRRERPAAGRRVCGRSAL